MPDLADDGRRRWPIYTATGYYAGVRAIFAFPLQIGAAQVGVMDLFRPDPGPLSGPEPARTFVLADDAVGILLDGQTRSDAGWRGAAGRAGEIRAGPAELLQAQGMVQLEGRLSEAMSSNRAHAFAENRRLIDVARDVVTRRRNFGTERPDR